MQVLNPFVTVSIGEDGEGKQTSCILEKDLRHILEPKPPLKGKGFNNVAYFNHTLSFTIDDAWVTLQS